MHFFVDAFSPESGQNLPGSQSSLHLIPAGPKNPPKDVVPSQMQQELSQKQTSCVITHDFGFKRFLQTGYCIIHVQRLTQVENLQAFMTAERL